VTRRAFFGELAQTLPHDFDVIVKGLVLVSPALDLSALHQTERDLLAAAFVLQVPDDLGIAWLEPCRVDRLVREGDLRAHAEGHLDDVQLGGGSEARGDEQRTAVI